MTNIKQSYDEQSSVWNGVAGRAWTDEKELMNEAFRPVLDRLVEEVRMNSPYSILDVGCGTGATTLAIAEMRPDRLTVGVDVSEVMISDAQVSAQALRIPAKFVCADAQTYAFSDSFDMIVSRFGIMFFDEPILAFQNLRRACLDDAQLRLIAFRSANENPFMTTAERAAAPLLPSVPARADGPGQFAFADTERVRAILEQSGWTDLEFEPVNFECSIPTEKLQTFFTRLGPLSRILHKASDELREIITTEVRNAFEPYVRSDRVQFRAACWMISAQANGCFEKSLR